MSQAAKFKTILRQFRSGELRVADFNEDTCDQATKNAIMCMVMRQTYPSNTYSKDSFNEFNDSIKLIFAKPVPRSARYNRWIKLPK